MSVPLPELLDCRALMLETGMKRSVAEAVMRQVPTVQFPGVRKVFVRRSDVQVHIDACTYDKTEVPAA